MLHIEELKLFCIQLYLLTHFLPISPFCTSWKYKKTSFLLMFSGCTSWKYKKTSFLLMFSGCTSWKYKKTSFLLMFSGCIEREYWEEIGWYIKLNQLFLLKFPSKDLWILSSLHRMNPHGFLKRLSSICLSILPGR